VKDDVIEGDCCAGVDDATRRGNFDAEEVDDFVGVEGFTEWGVPDAVVVGVLRGVELLWVLRGVLLPGLWLGFWLPRTNDFNTRPSAWLLLAIREVLMAASEWFMRSPCCKGV
jgi:hypothetical protein